MLWGGWVAVSGTKKDVIHHEHRMPQLLTISEFLQQKEDGSTLKYHLSMGAIVKQRLRFFL